MTDTTPPETSTVTRCGPLRSDGIAASTVAHVRPDPEAPVTIPIEFAAGFAASRIGRHRDGRAGIPPKPSNDPVPPSALGCVRVASAKASVRPSAPVPPPVVSSKLTCRRADARACGQNAEPCWEVDAGVSWSAPPIRRAAPFSCHPPAVGGGTVFKRAPVPVNVTVCAPVSSLPLITH